MKEWWLYRAVKSSRVLPVFITRRSKYYPKYSSEHFVGYGLCRSQDGSTGQHQISAREEYLLTKLSPSVLGEWNSEDS